MRRDGRLICLISTYVWPCVSVWKRSNLFTSSGKSRSWQQFDLDNVWHEGRYSEKTRFKISHADIRCHLTVNAWGLPISCPPLDLSRLVPSLYSSRWADTRTLSETLTWLWAVHVTSWGDRKREMWRRTVERLIAGEGQQTVSGSGPRRRPDRNKECETGSGKSRWLFSVFTVKSDSLWCLLIHICVTKQCFIDEKRNVGTDK